MRTRGLIIAVVAGGGLFALTYFGSSDTPEDGTPSPTPSESAALPSGPDGRAQQLVIKGLEAQGVFYVDNVHFAAGAGNELAELRQADPSLQWGKDVMVVVPASEGEQSKVVVVRAASSTGRVFCGAEIATRPDAGTWYASTVGAPCPLVVSGMPGWSMNRLAGWL